MHNVRHAAVVMHDKVFDANEVYVLLMKNVVVGFVVYQIATR